MHIGPLYHHAKFSEAVFLELFLGGIFRGSFREYYRKVNITEICSPLKMNGLDNLSRNRRIEEKYS